MIAQQDKRTANGNGRSSSARAIRVAHVTNTDSSLRFLLLPQLRRLREEGFEVLAISPPGPWVAQVEAFGIRHVEWPTISRRWNLRADLRASIDLAGIVRRERVEVLHLHTPKVAVLGRVVGRVAGIPVVVNTVHGLYATPEDRLRKRLAVLSLERATTPLSDLELYQSEEDLAWVHRSHAVSPSRSVLLGNGIDLSSFDPSAVSRSALARLRGELGIPNDAMVVGTVARMVVEKGYREFFAAARAVRAAIPNAHFIVVGAPDTAKVDAITEDEVRAAGPNVTVTGWREDVRELLALMDVFVLASWREGVPRSAIEAAAMARPLVLTNVRGCREVARDGVEGLLVPARDAESLAAAIVHLLRDPVLRAQFGAAARERASERFDERVVTDTIVRAYRRLLHAGPTHRQEVVRACCS
jgi:glycosyltransferase involved in cell wall biosynthesis